MKFILTFSSIFFLFSGISFSQPRNVYDIYALEYSSTDSRMPASKIAVGGSTMDSVSFSYYFWFLNGDNGRKILVDVGYIRDYTQPLAGQKYVRPDSVLKRINVNPDEITDIIITHPHYDHINGLPLFGKGTIWMQKKDFDYFVRDGWQKGATHIGLVKADVINTVQANLDGRLQLVDGDSIEIIPGIRVFTGSKHTFECHHLLVNSTTDKVLLASDDSWFYYNIDNLLSVPLTFDTKAYVTQLKRMKTLVTNNDLIIPGHDQLVMSRFKQVAKGVVRIR
jgi:glyoxylase-like metal-dependent hydrolase (beta-lactamase superfamily II)